MNECKSFFPISNVGVGFLFGAHNTFSLARVVMSLGFKKDGARMEVAQKISGIEKLTGSHMCMQQSVLFFCRRQPRNATAMFMSVSVYLV